jgi:hypothetical protein
MNQLEKLLENFIEQQRALHKEQPFLSDYENGEIAGVNETLDGIEEILSKSKEQKIKKYRAVLHFHKTANRKVIESVWFETEAEAKKAGDNGLVFYGAERFTIENNDNA